MKYSKMGDMELKYLLPILLMAVVGCGGCIQTEDEYYSQPHQTLIVMTKKESDEFHKNFIYVTLDDRGYLMLMGAVNGHPLSMNLDSIYMDMHNLRTKSYNIYDEQIAIK